MEQDRYGRVEHGLIQAAGKEIWWKLTSMHYFSIKERKNKVLQIIPDTIRVAISKTIEL